MTNLPTKITAHLSREYVVHLILILATSGFYFFFYSGVFLHLNGVLSSITDDSLKNYYTFVFHARYAQNPLHFSGFNFPFGEHVVFTDCQPLLSILLHYLPFTHYHLIGILHFLVFFSYIVSPSLIYLLFKKLHFPALYAIPVSIAVTLLSPQFYRIYAGHYALAYTCLIPLFFLLLFRYWNSEKGSSFWILLLFNFLIFFIHPYYGLGFSLFTFLSLLLYGILNKSFRLKTLIHSLSTGILPIALFQLFMVLSDEHAGRSPEPFGNTEFISNRASFFVPFFGPFKSFLEKIVQSDPAHFEGYCYLGLATLVLVILFILLIPFIIRNFKISKNLLVIFLSSLFFLMLSVGLHLKILEFFHFKIAALNQFRAMGRFSWFLYFSLPLFLFTVSYKNLQNRLSFGRLRILFLSLSGIYLIFHGIEARYYLTMYQGYWQDRNFFSEKLLNAEEKETISEIKTRQAQAILPLPNYFLGSEVFDRSTCAFPLIVSTLYSFHSGLPILSSYASRTSVNETETGINLLNSYCKENAYSHFLKELPVFVFCTNEVLLPDEERMASKLKVSRQNDSVRFGFLSKAELLKPVLDQKLLSIQGCRSFTNDSAGVIYIPHQNKGPYIASNFLNYEMAFVLDSNRIASGNYIVSVHFFPSGKTFREMGAALIVTKRKGKEYVWQDFLPLKLLSAFYREYGILERKIQLEKNCSYEFMINGGGDITYRIAHFLLRPSGTSVQVFTGSDTLYNNYPAHLSFSE